MKYQHDENDEPNQGNRSSRMQTLLSKEFLSSQYSTKVYRDTHRSKSQTGRRSSLAQRLKQYQLRYEKCQNEEGKNKRLWKEDLFDKCTRIDDDCIDRDGNEPCFTTRSKRGQVNDVEVSQVQKQEYLRNHDNILKLRNKLAEIYSSHKQKAALIEQISRNISGIDSLDKQNNILNDELLSIQNMLKNVLFQRQKKLKSSQNTARNT